MRLAEEYSCSECNAPAAATCPTCGRTFCGRHFGELLLCASCVAGYELDQLAEDLAELEPPFSCSCCWSAELAGVFND
jgi:hypothetical protein